jgi:hypothetical protein
MDFIFNYDTLNYIFTFIHPNQRIIISETCKTFNEIIVDRTFPKDSFLFSRSELIEWAIDHEYKIKKNSMFQKAIKYGNANVLQYLKDNVKNSNKYLKTPLFINAIDRESIDILEWLKKSRCLYNSVIFNLAAPAEIYNWVMTNLVWNSEQFHDVIESENIDTLMWVIKSVPFLSEYVCDIASECNSLKILKWAVHNNFKYGETTCSNAALNGNLKMVKFLRKNKCKWSSWTIADAASNGHNHVIKWCLKNKCQVDEYACCEAANNNHLDTLELLIENDCPIDDKTYYAAQKNPEIFEYLQKKFEKIIL